MSGQVRFAATKLPFYFEENDEGNGYKGHIAHLFNSFFENYRVNSSIVMEGLAFFGDINEDGTNGTGIVGRLVRNESDVSIIPMQPNYKTIRYLEFTNVVYTEEISIVSFADNPIPSVTFSLFSIYDQKVWYLFVIFVTILTLFSTRYSRMLNTRKDNLSTMKTLETGLFQFTSSALKQGVGIGTFYSTDLFIWGTWLIGCFCLSNAFSALILSKMTSPIIPDYIDNLRDVLNRKDIQIYVLKDTPVEDELKFTKDETMRSIWEKVQRDETCLSGEALEEIVNEIVLLDTNSVNKATLLPAAYLLEGLAQYKFCDLIEIKKKIHISNEKPPFSIQVMMAYGKNYQDYQIIRGIHFLAAQCFECGHSDFTVRSKIFQAGSCLSEDLSINKDTSVKPLDITNFKFTIHILFWLISVALFTFVLEIIICKLKTKMVVAKSQHEKRRSNRFLKIKIDRRFP